MEGSSPITSRGAKVSAEAFGQFVKPRMMELLGAIRLDVEFHRGRGDRLWYRDEAGDEVEVLDLLGGFGSSLLGHNHPRILAAARRVLDAERPFHAQASVRALAGRLGERLSERVGRSTGKAWIATFANSGTEAVEAALKHAEMERRARADAILARLRQASHHLRAGLRDRTAWLPDALFSTAARQFGLARVESLDDVLLRVFRLALDALEREPVFLAVEGAFHGKSSGAVQLTYNAEYQSPFRRIGPQSFFLPAGDEAALARTLDAARIPYLDLAIGEDGAVTLSPRAFINVAACFVEPIQGEGGVRETDPAYLRALRRAADEGGFPLVIDEIQSGMGRTGSFLASEVAGVAGDYYLFSKTLGGGLAKISALLVDRARYLPEFGYLHTSTFADDDFSSAVALEALDVLEENDGALMRQARERGDNLLAKLRALRERYPTELRDVRGRGLMIGIELCSQLDSPSPLVRVLSEQNLLGFLASGYLLREEGIRVAPTLSSHATIRLQPSAYVSDDELDRFAGALERLLVALRAGDGYRLTRFLVGRKDAAAAIEAPRRRAATSVPSGAGARIAFLCHFLEPGDVRLWDPTLAPLSDDDCEHLLGRIRGVVEPFVAERCELVSETGQRASLSVIAIPFTPAQVMESLRAGESEWALAQVRQAVEMARRLGCSIAGFGGYTSIVSDNCRAIVESDIALTSGNSLTAAAALEALFLAARRLDIRRGRLGIVGAAGNIGAVLAEVAADQVDEIVLVGRPGGLMRRLEAVAASLRAQHPTPVRVATEMEALRECNLVITATNAPHPVVLPSHLGTHPTVIADVAAPRDVDPRVAVERPRAVVLKGGLVRVPLKHELKIGAMKLDPAELYGCLAETILLGWAGIGENFSHGPLVPARVRRVRELALMHGYSFDERGA
jgi:acetylornithine/succinyldiaminopimelate/putrescine aminotransferase/predicted amino acid dehydrogenase